MSDKLLNTFQTLDQQTKDILDQMPTALLQAFAILRLAELKCATDRLSAAEISECLEASGVSLDALSIARALARANKRVTTKRNESDEITYKLMTAGQREVDPKVLGGLSVLRVDGDHPRTDRVRLQALLQTFRGDIRICDPYYGFRTLESLDYLHKSCHVRFLTGQSSEVGKKLTAALGDFKRERPNFLFRIAPNPKKLHDRYLVTSDSLLLLGHGIKDIGNSESFVIRIDKAWAPGLLADVSAAFDIVWPSATPL
jgi:hypothetical protein